MRTYKFRCECPDDYERIQAVCGEGMIEAKVIPQFINEIIPISDQEVEFKSTLSYKQLLHMFDGVVDAHIAFQTLMPIEEYTGERDYDRTTNNVLGRDMTDTGFYKHDELLSFNRRFREIVDEWTMESTGSDYDGGNSATNSDEDDEEEVALCDMTDAQIDEYIDSSGTYPHDEVVEWTMDYKGGPILRYSYVNFAGTCVANQQVSNIVIRNAKFTGSTLRNYVFDNVDFYDCDFKGVIVDNVTFRNSTFMDCYLHPNTLESCHVEDIEVEDIEVEDIEVEEY
jgi:hypothetical protein